MYVNRWSQRPSLGLGGDALAVIGIIILATNLSGESWSAGLTPTAMLLILLGSLCGKWSSRILSMPPVYLIGGMCYTLYLYHFTVISAVGRFVLPWLDSTQPLWFDLLLIIAFVLPAVLIVGAVLFVLIERPFMNWRPGRQQEKAKLNDRMTSSAGTPVRVGEK